MSGESGGIERFNDAKHQSVRFNCRTRAKTCQYLKENYKKMHFFIKRWFIIASRAVFEIKKEQAIDEVKREKELDVFKR